jgi:hypothetical protein
VVDPVGGSGLVAHGIESGNKLAFARVLDETTSSEAEVLSARSKK